MVSCVCKPLRNQVPTPSMSALFSHNWKPNDYHFGILNVQFVQLSFVEDTASTTSFQAFTDLTCPWGNSQALLDCSNFLSSAFLALLVLARPSRNRF